MSAPNYEARLARHPHFTPHTDPVSGVTSYILSERVDPLQKALYDGGIVVYTTSVAGRVDVAVTPVGPAVARLHAAGSKAAGPA